MIINKLTILEKLNNDYHKNIFNRYVGMISDCFEKLNFNKGEYEINEAALGCAFIYFMNNNELFAKRSLNCIEKYIEEQNENEQGLYFYWKLYYVSWSYYFCKNSISWKKRKSKINNWIKEQSDWCFFDGGKSQNQAPSSNWKALRYSMAGIGYILGDNNDSFKKEKIWGCYQRVKNYFNANMGDGVSGIEGNGYTRYAWGGVGPFLSLAEKLYGFESNKLCKEDIKYQIMWSFSNMVPIDYVKIDKEFSGVCTDFVTDSPNHSSLIFISFAYKFLDESEIYGLNQILKHKIKDYFKDNLNHAVMYFLNYHYDFGNHNPLEIPSWRKVFVEETGNGFITFRNKFEDENDIVASMYGNFRKHSGHQGPDQASFRIIGLNNIWTIGGGWYKDSDANGVAHFLRNANTIYPEGHGGPNAEKLHKPFKNTGKLVEAKTLNSQEIEGHAIISCFAQNDFDTEGHTRRFAAKFNIDCEAAFIVADTTLNGRYWQLCTAYHNEIECGENWFLIKDPLTGSSMKGHVLHPSKDLSIYSGERQRGSEYWFREGIVTKNKYVIVERTDPILGLTDDMITVDGKELKNRGGRNSLFYNRNEEGKIDSPKYDQERDFIVVLTLCKENQQHPQVTLRGERILSGVSIMINDYECYTDLNTMRLGI